MSFCYLDCEGKVDYFCKFCVTDYDGQAKVSAISYHYRKRLQGAVDARKRPVSYTSVCEQADDKADAVPCDCLRFCEGGGIGRRTGLRIQPTYVDGGSIPPSRTNQ